MVNILAFRQIVAVISLFLVFEFIFIFLVEKTGNQVKIPVISSLSSQQLDMKRAAQMRALNFYIPSFYHLLMFQEKGVDLDKDQWEVYRNYYQKVAEFIPQFPETYVLIGTCDYYLGDSASAMEEYHKAIDRNPDFFLAYYNLAIVLLKQGRSVEAIAMLARAIKTDPVNNFKSIISSDIITQIYSNSLLKQPGIIEYLKNNFEEEFKNSVVLIQEHCYEAKACTQRPKHISSLNNVEPKLF